MKPTAAAQFVEWFASRADIIDSPVFDLFVLKWLDDHWPAARCELVANEVVKFTFPDNSVAVVAPETNHRPEVLQ